MTPLALSWFAIVLLAAGTPRQARLVLGRGLTEPARRAARGAGIVLLVASLALLLVMESGDRARAIVGWVALTGLEALLTALAFTVIAWWRAPDQTRTAASARPSPPNTRR